MLAELLATDGVEEICHIRSTVGVMAFHGGSLEAMTDVVATDVAEKAGASLYAIRQPWGFRWHIPSKQLDPAQSEAMSRFIDHVDTAVAIHGWGTDGWTRSPTGEGVGDRSIGSRPERPILVGGTNRGLAAQIGRSLRSNLEGYAVIDDIHEIPRRLRGLHPRNPVNLPPDGGVQLELPPRVRGLPPFWTGASRGRGCPHTKRLIAALSDVLAEDRVGGCS